MFVHMLKYFKNENHILHNSLCESNSLIKKYKRRNRILCDKVDNLKKKIQYNKSMENEDKFLFEGQECLSHALLICAHFFEGILIHAYGISIVAVLVI